MEFSEGSCSRESEELIGLIWKDSYKSTVLVSFNNKITYILKSIQAAYLGAEQVGVELQAPNIDQQVVNRPGSSEGQQA